MLTYTTPELTFPRYFTDLAQQAHVLIGGTTGAGKSTALNGFLRSLMRFTPDELQLVLVDPKAVELQDWQRVPHTVARWISPEEITDGLKCAADYMEKRFKQMQADHVKRWQGPELYIIIDEYIDIKLRAEKAQRDIIRIACKGRAAGIHLIICTQRPTRQIIDGTIRACLPAVLALRCSNAQESRNLIDQSGAEKLPRYGSGLYLTPSAVGIQRVDIPYYSPEDIEKVISFWEKQI